MNRIIGLLFTVALVLSMSLVRAHEGIWIPMLLSELNHDHMKASGLRLSAEDIYSINKSSLKDAIAHFGGGCTSEVISKDGLLLTNHHCGYSQIQQHSSVENDYLSDGFWAMNKSEELPNPGLTATFIVRMEDVTKKVFEGVTDGMELKEREALISKNSKAAKEAAVAGTHYDGYVRPFYNGNEYYLFVTETFEDVRFVGAPPSSIGKFGFDTDNWVWPRHTGDFSIFRIYADKDNKPAKYSKDNVPYQPRHHLPINLQGVEEGDFTMVYGFPGRTYEYLSSYAVDYITNKSNPAKIEMRKMSLSIIDAAMASSDKTRIQYAAKQSRISNAYKKWIGQNMGLKRFHAMEKKQELEAQFLKECGMNPKYQNVYGTLLNEFKKTQGKIEKYALARDYFIETVYYGPESIRFASNFTKLVQLASDKNTPPAELEKEVARLRTSANGYFKNYDVETDKKLFAALLKIYHQNVALELQPEVLKSANSRYKGDFNAYAEMFYEKSALVSEASVENLLKGFNKGSASKFAKRDPAYLLMQSFFKSYREGVRPSYDKLKIQMDDLDRRYMKGLMVLLPDYKNYYPDANGTLRLTYGKVEGYQARDAVNYRYYTTLDGIIQKMDPDNKEFNVPEKLVELQSKKDYGRYGKDGEMRVCFTASNHTTGGNSGSPVLDGQGRLIGLNFDRTWESTMSDIMFNPEICRNISVDIRYVLFIIDKFAGAGHLVEEMTLIEGEQN